MQNPEPHSLDDANDTLEALIAAAELAKQQLHTAEARIGGFVMAWIASGGGIELHPATPTQAPAAGPSDTGPGAANGSAGVEESGASGLSEVVTPTLPATPTPPAQSLPAPAPPSPSDVPLSAPAPAKAASDAQLNALVAKNMRNVPVVFSPRPSSKAMAPSRASERKQPCPPARERQNPEVALTALGAVLTRVGCLDRDAQCKEAAAVAEATLHCVNAGVSQSDPRLVRLLAGFVSLLEGARLKPLRKAIRDSDVKEQATPSNTLPTDWPHFALTEAKCAIIVGGEPRQPAWDKLKATFRFAELDWEHTEFKAKAVQRVRERVLAGKVDAVFVLHQWCPHSVDEALQDACKQRGIWYVPVAHSYGIHGFSMAIARFWRTAKGLGPTA